MTARAPLNTSLSSRPFHVRTAETQRVPSSRLRAHDLNTPYRGVRQLREPHRDESNLVERCHAYAPLLRPGHLFSHGSAAALWGLWLPRRVEQASVIDVTAILSARAPRMVGVRGHHVNNDTVERMLVDSLPVTSPLDTWRQLSTVLSINELVAVGDSLVRRQGPLVAEQQLDVALARHAGRRGVRKLRAAFHKVRAGTDSPKETELRLTLTSAGLPEPAVNAIVTVPGETPIRFGDLVYDRWKVIVEYDGRHHRFDAIQYDADIERLEQLARAGWLVVRIVDTQLRRPRELVARVSDALRAHGWRPPSAREMPVFAS